MSRRRLDEHDGAKPCIWHLSGDFPDPVASDKTPVIQRLIDLTEAEFDHTVVSINRQSMPGQNLAISAAKHGGVPRLELSDQAFRYGRAIVYNAPPRGLWHASMLRQLGDHLVSLIDQAEHKPALIVAHKLTIEGIAVAHVAEAIGMPYAVTLQGTTDRKIVAARPDLRRLYGQIYRDAATVFAFAPHTPAALERMLGIDSSKCRLLPCPTDLDEPLAPQPNGDGLISVFHLHNHKLKNLSGLSRAARILEREGMSQCITVYGGGSERELAACKSAAYHSNSIAFSGPLNRAQMRKRMNAATALVMPSLSESFGLVFIEALFCGLPIIYPAGRAVDGWFDNAPFALRVDPGSPRDIASAMQYAVENEAAIKHALQEWQVSAEATRFTRTAIADQFSKGLNAALGA